MKSARNDIAQGYSVRQKRLNRKTGRQEGERDGATLDSSEGGASPSVRGSDSRSLSPSRRSPVGSKNSDPSCLPVLSLSIATCRYREAPSAGSPRGRSLRRPRPAA